MPQPPPPSGQNGPRGKVSSPQGPGDEEEEVETPGKPKPSEQLKRPHSATKRPIGKKVTSAQPPQMSPRPVTEAEEETSKRSSGKTLEYEVGQDLTQNSAVYKDPDVISAK